MLEQPWLSAPQSQEIAETDMQSVVDSDVDSALGEVSSHLNILFFFLTSRSLRRGHLPLLPCGRA